jgi:DNA-binding NarL/FixJ family response regulator
MPIILVVDDSPFDRHLTGRLLRKEKELDWVIEYAENGREALAFMKDLVPHVVVTDLMMPDVDGLELVAAVRSEHPEVPVILMTGQGSETLALEALERGAASYVPKGQLADKLVDTVKQVLAVARADSRYQRLTECFVNNQISAELDNDPALISPLVDLVQKMLTDMRFCDAPERVHLGIALEEALLNAFCHGSLALPAEQVQEARAELSQGRVAPCMCKSARRRPALLSATKAQVSLTRQFRSDTTRRHWNGDAAVAWCSCAISWTRSFSMTPETK